MTTRFALRAVGAVLTLGATACSKSQTDPRMVSEWMHVLYGTVRVERLSPPVAARAMVYASSALYSGMAAAYPKLKPVAGLRWYPSFTIAGGGLD